MEDDNLNDSAQVGQSSGAEKVDKAGKATAGAIKKGKMLVNIIKSLKGLGALGTVAIIAIVIILVIIIATGLIAYVTEGPGLLINKVTDIATSFFTELKTFYSGNSARFGSESQKELAEYLTNMGYKPYEFGFGKYTDEDGNFIENGDSEEATMDSKYLNAYLTADYNTYVPYEKFKAGVSKFLNIVGDVGGFLLGFETEKDTAEPAFGMIYFEKGVHELGGESIDRMGFLDSVETDVENKTMTFAAWEAPFKKTYYTYSMEGWTARYGKPIELSLALHIATMAPDLVYRLDMDEEEDTKIHIGTSKSKVNIKFEYHVNSMPEGGTNFGGIDDSLEDLDNHLQGETHKLTVDDLQTLKDFIESNKVSKTVENVKAGYSNYEAFLNASIENGRNMDYIKKNEAILQRYDSSDDTAFLNYEFSIEEFFNKYLDEAISKAKESNEDLTFYTDEVGKSYAEIVGKTVHDYFDDGYLDKTTGIMNEFYKKYEIASNDVDSPGNWEVTDEEAEELFTLLQDEFSKIKDNVKADVDKLIENDKKTSDKVKELEKELEKIGLTTDAIDAAIDYNNGEGTGEGTEVTRIQPYITYVEKHWYRDVIFEDTTPDQRYGGYHDTYSTNGGGRTYENQFQPVEQSDDSALGPNDKGAFYTIETVEEGGQIVQVQDAIRGETNEHTKELFAGTADKPAKYFIYDGSINTAKKIDELRKVYDDAYSAAWDASLEFPNERDEKARAAAEAAVEQKEAEDGTNFYKEVNVRQNALEAFAILENSKTEDSEYILRDLKRLFLDLGYFTKEDFIKEETHVFQWPISGYINTYWPQRRYEKQQADYGTLIRSKVSTDNINAGKEADGSERIKEDEEVQIYKPNFNHDATAGEEEGVPDLDAEETTPTDQTTTTSQDFVTKFLDAAKEVTTYVKENGFTYGHAEHMPPDSNGETNSDGVKRISCDRLVAWALHKCGYTDQPECGLTTSAGGSPLMDYCKEKGWERIEDVNQVQAGDIVFSGATNADKSVAGHTFICAGKDLRYDCGSADRIQLTGAYSSYKSQPFSEPITDFICAYRPAGSGKTGAIDGFEKDLNVLSPVTGEILEEGEDYIKIKVLDTSAIPEYEEFYNEYKGICTGFTMYIRGFKKGTIDENVESEYQKVTHTNKYFIENGYADDYEDVEPIAEEFEEAEKKRMEAPAYIEKDGKKYIKEGTVIGTTTSSDLGLYLMNRENSIVEDVESYIRLVKKGIETEFPEEFIFWLGVELEGACEGEYDLGDSYGVEVLNDGAGNTTAFGLTHHVANVGEVPNMYPNFKEHLQSGRVPKKEAQDVFVLVLEAARATILEDIPDQNGLSESMLDALVDLHHASPSECGKVVKIFNEKKTLTVEDFENHWGTNMNYEKQLKGRGHVRGVLAVDEEYRNPYSDSFPKYTFHTETPWTDFINGTPSSQIATLG